MNTRYVGFASWISLVVAILSWCGVGFLLFTVFQMQSERAAYMADIAASNLQEGQAAQLRILARETEPDRQSLDTIADVDLLSAVNLIESVNATGTSVHVTSAQPVKTAPKGSQQISQVDLTANAQGSFASVMRIARMLETLPLATTVQEMDISRAPVDPNAKSAAATWSLNVRLSFYTTSALSS